MKLLSYIFSQTIIRESSKFNRDIRVVVENGKKKLLVNGIQQSGPDVQKFWDFAFKKLLLPKNVSSILVLGVGGGTVFEKLHRTYANVLITGVDIDEKIVEISKKYFEVRDRLVVADAQIYVLDKKKHYDLIVVDLYIGRAIPDFESSSSFIRNLKRIGKTVIFNFLHDGIYEQRSQELIQKLSYEFKKVEVADLLYNRFFLVVK